MNVSSVLSEQTRLGNIAESKAMTMFESYGYPVSIPHTKGTVYDFLVDLGGQNNIKKVQVKYCDSEDNKRGSVRCNLQHKVTINGKRKYVNYSEEDVDIFVLYVKKMDKFAYIPFRLTDNKGSICFRVEESDYYSDNCERFNLIDDYSFEKMIEFFKDSCGFFGKSARDEELIWTNAFGFPSEK